jgi:hypothetical protein
MVSSATMGTKAYSLPQLNNATNILLNNVRKVGELFASGTSFVRLLSVWPEDVSRDNFRNIYIYIYTYIYRSRYMSNMRQTIDSVQHDSGIIHLGDSKVYRRSEHFESAMFVHQRKYGFIYWRAVCGRLSPCHNLNRYVCGLE